MATVLAILIGGISFFLFSTDHPLQWEIGLIRLYQRHLSPILATTIHCRFHPSCSQYALQELSREGLLVGNLHIAGRLIHCSPIGALWDYTHR